MVWSKGGCGFAGLGSVRLPAAGYRVRSSLPAYHSSSRSKSEPERGTELLCTIMGMAAFGLGHECEKYKTSTGGQNAGVEWGFPRWATR